MLDELFVIVGAELILLTSIAVLILRARRMDVLSGRYFSNQADPSASLDRDIDFLPRSVERERAAVDRMRTGRLRVPNSWRSGPSIRHRGSRGPMVPGSHVVGDHARRAGASEPRVVTRVMGGS